MIRMIFVELQKLRGSLALALALLAPALPGFLAFLSLLNAKSSPRWASVIGEFVFPLWALFLLPMVIAAFTTLVGQIEYRTRGWDHILALPIPRWQIFTAKIVVVLGVNMAMTALVLIYAWAGAAMGGALGGFAPVGPMPWESLSERAGWLLASSTMLVVLQTWAALRFASFVVPLSIGIAGTLVSLAVAMTQAREADCFPGCYRNAPCFRSIHSQWRCWVAQAACACWSSWYLTCRVDNSVEAPEQERPTLFCKYSD